MKTKEKLEKILSPIFSIVGEVVQRDLSDLLSDEDHRSSLRGISESPGGIRLMIRVKVDRINTNESSGTAGEIFESMPGEFFDAVIPVEIYEAALKQLRKKLD